MELLSKSCYVVVGESKKIGANAACFAAVKRKKLAQMNRALLTLAELLLSTVNRLLLSAVKLSKWRRYGCS